MNFREKVPQKKIKSLLLYSLYYAGASNQFAEPIAATLRLGNTASFKEKLQRWRSVGYSVFDLAGPEFEP